MVSTEKELSLESAGERSNGERVIKYRRLKPIRTGEMKVLLLENVEVINKALNDEELAEKLMNVHALGIRSKTKISETLVRNAPMLLTIGCFCIGTDQIAVFNSPFGNSRSVAEMVLAEIIALSRGLGDRNREMHSGLWNKTAAGCVEVRGKTLGIVGYGHIGSQLSVLAESLGMHVIFYDVLPLMPLGRAQPVSTLDSLLTQADYVTLHVPELETTLGLIGDAQLSKMKQGSFLINASRGKVVDLVALRAHLESGHLAGAALDVYPEEPERNGSFKPPLAGMPNVILTPHIGGSTAEAQQAIGQEVALNMIKFLEQGSTLGAYNLPGVHLAPEAHQVGEREGGVVHGRLLNFHHNVPGVLNKINQVLSRFNIDAQMCDSRGPVAYVMVDLSVSQDADLDWIFEQIYNIPESIATRVVI